MPAASLLASIRRDTRAPADLGRAGRGIRHCDGRRPEVFCDPRALKDGSEKAVLHAMAVVADDRIAFVTSANLTEKAFDENIEVGLLTRDRTVALSLAKHFSVLIERGILEPLPV